MRTAPSLPETTRKRIQSIASDLVPEDIGFAHIHWEGTKVPCAGIHHQGQLAGAAAVDLISGMLQRNELGLVRQPSLVLTPGQWVEGPTVVATAR